MYHGFMGRLVATTLLLATALASGGCLRAHETGARAVAGDTPAGEASPAGTAAASGQPGHPAIAAAAPAPAVDFATQVRPLLEGRCQPCHFAGGTMYEKLPFDDPATIRHLGEQLFTRIKAEEERAVIRAFLARAATQPATAPDPAAARH